MRSRQEDEIVQLRAGNRVRIRQSHRSPNSGQYGVISAIDLSDNKGPFLVRFDDGTQFRYQAEEIEPAHDPEMPKRNHLIGRIMKSHFQALLAVILVSSFLAAACGPAPAPKPEAKAEESDDQKPAVQEKAPEQTAQQPQAQLPAEEPRQVASKPKPKPVTPAVKDTPKQPAATHPANSANSGNSQATQDTASNRDSAPGTLTLPAPVAPPVAAPAPPPVDEPKPVEPPAPRVVRVPSGTLVGVRMIDSIDSETSRVGETFKASLDAPIVVDNETVFPKGSEVYVKIAKVQAAGRVSGRSELQLQLDRIFLGRKSYLLDSGTYVTQGASQTGRTARSAGIGAAIGAAIGAISGGGKGAVIGGATGAGAGAGVEAVRKGEQVKVDSETRLDFRLEEPIEVTLQSPSPVTSQRNNPSGPQRLGTRP